MKNKNSEDKNRIIKIKLNNKILIKQVNVNKIMII